MRMNVDQYIAQYRAENTLKYVFVAYTAEQFRMPDDLQALHQIADAAARNAGATAYWVGCSCMPDKETLQDDVRILQLSPRIKAYFYQVYRICDVIRGADSVAIAVARPRNDRGEITTTELMLQQWGRRIWTFPEVLLAPAGRDIRVYTRGTDLTSPLRVPKNQFTVEVWRQDASVARQVGCRPIMCDPSC